MKRACLIHRLLPAVVALINMATAADAAPTAEPRIVAARIGFGGVYKLGCWSPLEVELRGGTTPYTGRLAVTVPDTDGVPTTIYCPVGVDPQQTTTVRLHVRVGQSQSSVRIRYLADGKIRSERTFYAGPETGEGIVAGGVPATNRVLLELGPSLGLGELLRDAREDDVAASRVAHIDDAADLPTRWYGYESIDTVLLATSQPEIYRPLMQNRARVEALRRWVEQGGRLVLFCGAQGDQLLGSDGPLAGLIPGSYVETASLRQAQPLETFSGAEQAITRDRRVNLSVARLGDVQGQILAYAGGRPRDLPLVVRSRLGLGELVFVGLDFDRPPLRDWPGRTSFLRRVLNWQAADETTPQQNQVFSGTVPSDLVGQLRNSLDQRFAGVHVVSFGWVALLAALYILLIGPGDYWFVHRVLRKSELTWLTFPLIVVGVSAAAYWYAHWMKGDQLRVNQVEIVDVDTINGQARGTAWTHFFTPSVDQFNLTFQPSYLGAGTGDTSRSIVSWLGLPGYGMGGMQARGSQRSLFDSGYAFGDGLASMQNVPVQVWSTKTITARWSAPVESAIEATLRRSGEELLNGQVVNATGVELDDCQLLYGRWAYHLGRMVDGAAVTIDDSLRPRTVRTLLTSATAGDTTIRNTADDGTVPFRLAQNDVTRLVKAMMFYRAINGHEYTAMVHRYQSFLDLTHLLEQDDRAILVGRLPGEGSHWRDDDRPLASDEDHHWTYYRFVLPVTTND